MPPKRNAALQKLKETNKRKGNGWLRSTEGIATGKHLNTQEKQLAMALFFALQSVEDTAGPQVAKAWGITRQSIHGWEKK
jgi:hypothetical protein